MNCGYYFLQESSVDWGEVEEALVLVRGRRGAEGREKVEPLSFLERVDDEEDKGQLVALTSWKWWVAANHSGGEELVALTSQWRGGWL